MCVNVMYYYKKIGDFMALISVSNLEKSYGERTLFSDVSFNIEKNDKIGFVGANGTGKTTIFKILTGELTPDKGGVVRESGLNFGYMEQQALEDSEKTALDEILAVFSDLITMENELSALTRQMETDHSAELIEKHAALSERFVEGGGMTYQSRAKATMAGLGFSMDEIDLPVWTLSGGQKSKIALGRQLLRSPQLMLLDEPTNHLDINASIWLEEYLKSYSGACFIISHDRFFLDRICNRIFELEHGTLYTCNGNYTKYTAVKEERRLSLSRQYDNTIKEIERIEGIIKQQRQWNRERNIKMAESKEKQIERLKKTLIKPDAAPKDIHFDFRLEKTPGNDILKVENISKTFENVLLYGNVSFDVKRGERVFFIGANGCGKTTLLGQIMAAFGNEDENIAFGTGISIGYFEQTHATLSASKDVISEVWDAFIDHDQQEIRSALAAFMFFGDDVFKKISDLSGGERARVALCKLMLAGSNLLFLDEPTNHLDIYSREALENALKSYPGTLIMVSHDRYFINKLATKICGFENGTVRVVNGRYDDYLRLFGEDLSGDISVKNETKTTTGGGDEYKRKKQQQSELRRINGAISRCEGQLYAVEEKIAEINEQLAHPENAADFVKVSELSKELSEYQTQESALMEEWESLEKAKLSQ